MKGRALIDLPAHGLKCGEYGDLPKAVAGPLIKAGHFDPKAVQEADASAGSSGEPDGAGAGADSGAGADTSGDAGVAAAGGQAGGGEGDSAAAAVTEQTGPEV